MTPVALLCAVNDEGGVMDSPDPWSRPELLSAYDLGQQLADELAMRRIANRVTQITIEQPLEIEDATDYGGTP